MERMIDVVALAKRYCPEAEIAGTGVTVAANYVDMATIGQIIVFTKPEFSGKWVVTIGGAQVSFDAPDRETAETLGRALTTQVELSKAQFLEEVEGMQRRTLEECHR